MIHLTGEDFERRARTARMICDRSKLVARPIRCGRLLTRSSPEWEFYGRVRRWRVGVRHSRWTYSRRGHTLVHPSPADAKSASHSHTPVRMSALTRPGARIHIVGLHSRSLALRRSQGSA